MCRGRPKDYSLKLYNAFPPSDSDCYLLVDAASGILDPLDMGKAGVYTNGNLSSSTRLAAEKGYTLQWLQGGFEVKGGPWDTEQEALAAAKKVRENLNALMKSTGKSGDLELLDPAGKRVKLISIA